MAASLCSWTRDAAPLVGDLVSNSGRFFADDTSGAQHPIDPDRVYLRLRPCGDNAPRWKRSRLPRPRREAPGSRSRSSCCVRSKCRSTHSTCRSRASSNEALDFPAFSDELIGQINFDNTNYVTNDQLTALLEERGATETEISAAVEIFEDARLRALRTTMMFLAALALLAPIPAGNMPDFREPDLTEEDEEGLTRAVPRPGGE